MVRVRAEDGNMFEGLFTLHVDELAHVPSPRLLNYAGIFGNISLQCACLAEAVGRRGDGRSCLTPRLEMPFCVTSMRGCGKIAQPACLGLGPTGNPYRSPSLSEMSPSPTRGHAFVHCCEDESESSPRLVEAQKCERWTR